MRAVVAIFGTICVSLVFVVERLGAVLQLSMSLGAVTNGPLLGIFTMGVLLPWVHGRGAIIGGATGLGMMAWICAKAQAAIASGELTFPVKPTTTQGCVYHFIPEAPYSMLAINMSVPDALPTIPSEPEFEIYHISYLWYTFIGAMVTIIVSLIASFLMGANDPQNMDPKLFAPFVRRILERKKLRLMDVKLNNLGTEDDIRFASSLDVKNVT